MKRASAYLIASIVAVTSMLAVLPAHASTPTQTPGQPATYYWAVIVGISDYDGSTTDLPGSANDAVGLKDHLHSLGWKDDHIWTITNKGGTRDKIIQAIRWLASKTNSQSTAVFHYSGHQMPRTISGKQHQQLRTRENKFILDTELGNELGKVHAGRMWIDLSNCRAAGFSDSGIVGKNRVVTFAAPEKELAYEDTGLKQSVFSYHMITGGMRAKKGDKNRDGKVSVEEAFWYSRGPVAASTNNKQHPAMNDQLSGDLSIKP